jgi:predicted Holliday junction resolvase-like endonuclease
MELILSIHREELRSLKGQLEYVNTALSSDLKEWERKEYLSVKKSCSEDIEKITNHIELCETL